MDPLQPPLPFGDDSGREEMREIRMLLHLQNELLRTLVDHFVGEDSDEDWPEEDSPIGPIQEDHQPYDPFDFLDQDDEDEDGELAEPPMWFARVYGVW